MLDSPDADRRTGHRWIWLNLSNFWHLLVDFWCFCWRSTSLAYSPDSSIFCRLGCLYYSASGRTAGRGELWPAHWAYWPADLLNSLWWSWLAHCRRSPPDRSASGDRWCSNRPSILGRTMRVWPVCRLSPGSTSPDPLPRPDADRWTRNNCPSSARSPISCSFLEADMWLSDSSPAYRWCRRTAYSGHRRSAEIASRAVCTGHSCPSTLIRASSHLFRVREKDGRVRWWIALDRLWKSHWITVFNLKNSTFADEPPHN